MGPKRSQRRQNQKQPKTTERVTKRPIGPATDPQDRSGPPSPTDGQSTRPGSGVLPGAFVPFSGAGRRLGEVHGPGSLTVPVPSRRSNLKPAPRSLLFPEPRARVSRCVSEGTQKLKNANHMDSSTKQTEFLEPLDRKPLVYHMDSKENPGVSEENFPEDFFQVTAEDIKRRYAQLQTERRTLEEAPLLTSALREDQVLRQMQRHPQVAIRVCFADRHVLQGLFRPLETVGNLKQFVRNHLADPQLEFWLYGAPGSLKMEDPNATLYEANLFPNALLYLSSGSRTGCLLHPRHLGSIVSSAEADAAMRSCELGSLSTSHSSLAPEGPFPLPAASGGLHQSAEARGGGQLEASEALVTNPPPPRPPPPLPSLPLAGALTPPPGPSPGHWAERT